MSSVDTPSGDRVLLLTEARSETRIIGFNLVSRVRELRNLQAQDNHFLSALNIFAERGIVYRVARNNSRAILQHVLNWFCSFSPKLKISQSLDSFFSTQPSLPHSAPSPCHHFWASQSSCFPWFSLPFLLHHGCSSCLIFLGNPECCA